MFTNHNGIPIPKNASRVLVMVQTQVALLGYTTHVMFSIGPHTHTHMSTHTHTRAHTHTHNGKFNRSSKVHKNYAPVSMIILHVGALCSTYYILFIFVFLWRCGPNAGHGLLILEVSRSHTTTHHSR